MRMRQSRLVSAVSRAVRPPKEKAEYVSRVRFRTCPCATKNTKGISRSGQNEFIMDRYSTNPEMNRPLMRYQGPIRV